MLANRFLWNRKVLMIRIMLRRNLRSRRLVRIKRMSRRGRRLSRNRRMLGGRMCIFWKQGGVVEQACAVVTEEEKVEGKNSADM